MEKRLEEMTTEELNEKCKKCMAEANKEIGTSFDYSKCERCAVGRAIHKLEVRSSSKWNDVDWNDSRYKEFYHR